MDNPFFRDLHRATRPGETFRIEVTRTNDSLDVVVIPKLDGDADKVPEDAKPIRAALAMPLAVRGESLDELCASFGDKLAAFGAARGQAVSAYDELLQTLSDAAAGAKNATAKKVKAGSKKTAAAKSETQIVPPDSGGSTKDRDGEADDCEAYADTKAAQGDGVLAF